MIPAVQHDPVETIIPYSLKGVTERDNDEKLAIKLFIVGTGLIAYHFW